MRRRAPEAPVVALLSIGALLSAACLRAPDPLLAPIGGELGAGPGEVAAAMVTGFTLTYGLLQVAHGPLGDRHGKVPMFVLMAALSALGCFASAAAPTLEWLAAARLANGAVTGALIPLAMAWIGDVVPWESRQPVLARFLIGQILGVALGPLAAGLAAQAFGWRGFFVVLGVLFVVVAVLLELERRRNPLARTRPADAPASLAAAVRRMFALLAERWVRVVVVTVFFEGALMFGAIAFAALHLQQAFGVGVGASGGLIAAYAAGAMLYAANAGRIVPRLGQAGLVRWGGMAAALGVGGFGLAPALWLAIPALVLAGVGFYMLHNTLQANATQMATARGAAVSLFALCLFSGQSAGVWLNAQAVDACGARPGFVVSALGLALLAVLFRRALERRTGHPS